jgi:atypical dual specificity phosphatase
MNEPNIDRRNQERNLPLSEERLIELVDRVDFVLPDVAISNCYQLQQPEIYDQYRFRSVLNLTRNQYPHPEGTVVERWTCLPLEDGPGNSLETFGRAVQLLADLEEGHAPVLVHCHAGTSRSPTVVAGLLVLKHHLTAEEALQVVAACRYCQINPALQKLLHDFARQLPDQS